MGAGYCWWWSRWWGRGGQHHAGAHGSAGWAVGGDVEQARDGLREIPVAARPSARRSRSSRRRRQSHLHSVTNVTVWLRACLPCTRARERTRLSSVCCVICLQANCRGTRKLPKHILHARAHARTHTAHTRTADGCRTRPTASLTSRVRRVLICVGIGVWILFVACASVRCALVTVVAVVPSTTARARAGGWVGENGRSEGDVREGCGGGIHELILFSHKNSLFPHK